MAETKTIPQALFGTLQRLSGKLSPEQLQDVLGQVDRLSGRLSPERLHNVLVGARRLAERLSSADELKRLDKSRLDFSVRNGGKEPVSSEFFPTLKGTFVNAESRESCARLVEEELPAKIDLVNFLQHLGVSANSNYNVEQLRGKVIENTIGARFRSEAMRHGYNPEKQELER